jgi:hypothetical protein
MVNRKLAEYIGSNFAVLHKNVLLYVAQAKICFEKCKPIF